MPFDLGLNVSRTTNADGVPIGAGTGNGEIPADAQYTGPVGPPQLPAQDVSARPSAPVVESVAPASPPAAPQPQQQVAPPLPSMLEATRTVHESGKQLTPEMQQNQDEAFDAENKAIDAESRVAQQRAEEEGRVLEAKNQHLANLQVRQAAAQYQQQQDMQKRVDAWESAVDEYKQAKIDPDRAHGSVGEQIGSAIAMALGAFGSALTKTPNYAMDIINRRIDQRVRAQEQEIEKKRGNVDLTQNAVAFFRQKGLDMNQAQLAARAALHDEVQSQLDSVAAKYKGPQTAAMYQAMTSANQARQQAIRTQQAFDAQGKTVFERTSQPAGGASVSDQLKINELGVDVPQADGTTKVYYARRKEDAQKASDAFVVAKSLKQGLSEMEQLVGNTRQSLSPAAKARVQKLADDMALQYGVLRHLGALSKDDYRYASQIGDPTSWFQRDSTTKSLIAQMRKTIDFGISSELEGRGILRTNLVGR